MVRPRSPLALLLVLTPVTLVACGGEDRGRPQAATLADSGAGDPCQATAGLQFQNIADFEGDYAQCDLAVAPVTDGMMPKCFFVNYDIDSSPRQCVLPMAKPCLLATGEQISDDLCVAQDPGIGGSPRDAKMEGADRCGVSKSALHYVGTNVAVCISPVTKRQGWGATLQVTFNWTSSGKATAPYDARAWDGVSFWIKKGTGPTGTAVLASVQDVYTAAPPESTPDGGASHPAYCSLVPTVSDAEKCDPFGAAVLMTDQWRFVKLPFAHLQQKGFGVPAPSGQIDASALVGLQFGFAAGNWDLWLDDIAFYKEAK